MYRSIPDDKPERAAEFKAIIENAKGKLQVLPDRLEMVEPVKLCQTCVYHDPTKLKPLGGMCLRSHFAVDTMRQNSRNSAFCDRDFSGWVAKPVEPLLWKLDEKGLQPVADPVELERTKQARYSFWETVLILVAALTGGIAYLILN